MIKASLIISLAIVFWSCSKSTFEKYNGVNLKTPITSKNIQTLKAVISKPGRVHQTYYKHHRVIPVFKIDIDDKGNEEYAGSSYSHTSWHVDDSINAWHNHFMPGLSAISGYNMTNVANFNSTTNRRTDFFKENVLVNTLYFPAAIEDTLKHKVVKRNYYLVSVYDEDTNNDSLINYKDLRRFYHFDLNVRKKTSLIPKNYSVLSSQYDYLNDFMYVKAKKDTDGNGKRDVSEPIHIFWINMKDPKQAKRAY